MILLEGDLLGPSLIAHTAWSSVVLIQSRFDTSRFDTNWSTYIAQKFWSLQVYSLWVNKKNILGEYSSFFKPSR